MTTNRNLVRNKNNDSLIQHTGHAGTTDTETKIQFRKHAEHLYVTAVQLSKNLCRKQEQVEF